MGSPNIADSTCLPRASARSVWLRVEGGVVLTVWSPVLLRSPVLPTAGAGLASIHADGFPCPHVLHWFV
eukprot:m.1212672 g.1212672  ORF g.1212672 m.1212672 type:complete len:69 (+) comp24599_c0_seq2:280-486(+)